MYEVNLWSSHPDEGNDDCNTGGDYASLAEAREVYDNVSKHFRRVDVASSQYIELTGVDIHEVKLNIEYKPSRDEATREFAMQQGMAFGCADYNDAMGY